MSMIAASDNDRIFLKIKNLEKTTKKNLRRALYDSGLDYKNSANKEILRKPKGGKLYIRKDRVGRRRRHIASAPGETHANMTGALRRSLGFLVKGQSQLEFGYGVEAIKAPDYAESLEFGTQKMASRPTLRNAIKAGRRNTINNIERAIKKGFK